MLRNLWTMDYSQIRGLRRHNRKSRKSNLFPAWIETLEDRALLTQFLVNTLTDEDSFVTSDAVAAEADGTGLSLREAIRLANANGGGANQGQATGDEIVFSSDIAGGTIILNAGLGQLWITDDLIINGADPSVPFFGSNITISGNDSTRIFQIDTFFDGPVNLSNLILTQGYAFGGNGGAIEGFSFSDITLDGVTVSQSRADLFGGGISVSGTTTIRFSDISGNEASNGGGIYNTGSLTIEDSTVGGFGSDQDTWERTSVNTGDRIYAYVDTQDSFNGDDFSTLLDVLDDFEFFIDSGFADGAHGPVAAGAVAPRSGSIFFEVDSFDESVESYQIYTSIINPANTIHEVDIFSNNNDTPASADSVSPGSIFAGEISFTDTDYYRLTNVAAGSRIVVMLDQDPDDDFFYSNTLLEILDASGNVVYDSHSAFFSDANVAGAVTAPNTGDYLIRIRESGFVGDTDYEFVVVVAAAGDQVVETEPNDFSFFGADLLTGNQFGQGELFSSRNLATNSGGGIYNTGTLTLEGFTSIEGNVAEDPFAGNASGGGIFNDGGTVTTGLFAFPSISSNTAQGSGGGIVNANGGQLNLTEAFIDFNSAGVSGGGIEVRSGVANLSEVTLDFNSAGSFSFFGPADGDGGGLAITGAATVSMNGGTISSNFAERNGAGIWNDFGTLNLDGVTLDFNTASVDGGGIWNRSGTVVLDDITLDSNAATGFLTGRGGAIYNEAGDLTVGDDSSLTANSAAASGGGIYNGDFGILALDDVSFEGNQATQDGGAVANLGTASVANSIIGPRTRGKNTFERNDANVGDLVFAFVDVGFSFVDASLEVQNDDGTLLDSVTGSFSGPVIPGTPVGQNGSVFFDVTPLGGGSTSDYQLYTAVVDPASAIGEAVNNDTRTNSQLIDFTGRPDGVLVDGHVTRSDLDFFRLENLAAGSRIVVMMDDDPDNDGRFTDTDLYISDANFRQAFGDNFSLTRGNSVVFEVFTAGTYYIEIGDGGLGDLSEGEYRFVVQVLDDSDRVPDDGDAETATLLMAGQYGEAPLAADGANKAAQGGAIYNEGSLNLSAGTIRNNQATGTAGGGIYNGGAIYNAGGTVAMTSIGLTGNAADHDGGAIYNAGGSVTISANSRINKNVAMTGGGIYNDVGGFLDIFNSQVSGNQASEDGGGIANFGTANLSNTDIGTERVLTDRSDFWEIPNANVGDLVFAYVDTQNAFGNSDSTLSVYSADQSLLEFDNNDGPSLSSVVAGADVPQAGSVFLEVRGFADNPVDDYQLYAAVVNPNDVINEIENNDTADSSALPVLSGRGTAFVQGSAASSDTDHFRLENVSEGDRIVVMVDDDPDNDGELTDTAVSILFGTNDVFAPVDDLSTNNGNAAGAYIVTAGQAGDYYIRIGNGFIGTATNYRFVVQVLSSETQSVSGGAEVEPNNTIDDAQDVDQAGFSLSPNSNITDDFGFDISTSIPHVTIDGQGDGTFDYYSFTVTAGSRAVFDIDGASFDTELFLFDANGNVLAQNDDNGSDAGSTSFLDSLIEYDLFTAGGTYYLGVGRFSSFPGLNPQEPIEGDAPPVGGTYTLHISIENHALNGGGRVTEVDSADNSNDVSATATGLALGQFGQGNLGGQRENVGGSNTAQSGGGIYNDGVLAISGGAVQNNRATGTTAGSHGGGIFNSGTAALDLTTVSGNSAVNDGGGIYNEALGILTLVGNTLIDGNTATDGGGLYNALFGAVTISDSTLSGNSADQDGGAIANFGSLQANQNTVFGTREATSPSFDVTDFWQRSGATAGQLIFAFVDASSSMTSQDSTLTVLANDGFTQIEFDDDDGPFLSSAVAGAAVSQAGNVFFQVEGFFGSEVDSYELYTAVVDSAPDVNETFSANDTAQSSQSLAVTANTEGILVAGTLSSSTDQDFYSLGSVASDSVVVVMLDNAVDDINLTDTDLFLVDFNGNILATGNNFSGSNANAVVFATAGNTQDVFVRIADGGFGSDTSYRFVVQIHQSSNRTEENEPNDEVSVADQLSAGQVGDGGVGGVFVGGANVAVQGGGIYNNGSAMLEDVLIENNLASFYGGGLFNDSAGIATVMTSSVMNNSADDSGGGLYNFGGGALDLLASRISGNMALFEGGGIYNAGDLEVTDLDLMDDEQSTLTNNIADSGGAIFNTGASFQLSATAVSDNIADGFGGGGLFNTGTATIGNNTLFSRNQADGFFGSGGAIYNEFFATLIVDPGEVPNPNIVFGGNQADIGDGGAIANYGTASIRRATIGDESTRLSPINLVSPFSFGFSNAEANDLWQIDNANLNDLIFAYIDTQNATFDRDSTLSVLSNDGFGLVEFDDDDGPGLSSVVAAAAVQQAGRVFFDVRNFGLPDPISDYQIYATVVSPTPGYTESLFANNGSTAGAENIDAAVTGNRFISGSLSSSSDQDVYSFHASVGDRIVVMLDGSSSQIDVLNGPSVSLASHSSFGSANAVGAVTITNANASANGIYYVRIGHNGSSTFTPGNYRFVVQVLSSSDQVAETEPNANISFANTLQIGQFGDGELAASATATGVVETDDFWRVDNVTATDAVFAYVDTANSTADRDSTLTVFGSQGNQIQFNDDGGPGLSSAVAGITGQTGSVSFDIRNFGFPDAMDYDFYVAVVDTTNAMAEIESNNTRGTATPINSQTLITGNLQDGSDDFFRFSAFAGDRIVVMMDNNPTGSFNFASTTLQLLDNSGNVLATNTSFFGDANAIGAFTVGANTAGPLFVRVSNSGFGTSLTNSDYRFVVQVAPTVLVAEQESNNSLGEATSIGTVLTNRSFLGQGSLERGGDGRQASNRAERGGGIYNGFGSNLTLEAVTIQLNQALSTDIFFGGIAGGGGIYNDGTLTIGNETERSFSFINDNFTGTSGSGAGIFNSPDGHLRIFDGFIFGNSANANGGGLANQGYAEIVRSTIGDVADANDFFTQPDAEQGQQVFAYVDTQRDSENGDSLLEIFVDENGNKMVTQVGNDDDSGPGLSSLVVGHDLADGGDVFFNVRSADPALPLAYDFYTAIVDTDDLTNEALLPQVAQDRRISVNSQTNTAFIEGTLAPTVDDRYRIQANAGDRIVVMLDGDPDGNGVRTFTELALLNVAGDTIQPLSASNSTPANAVDTELGANALGAVTIQTAGDYLLRIRAPRVNGQLTVGQGNYQFVVLVLPANAAVDEDRLELNNTPKAAVPLAAGQFGTGAIRVLAGNEATNGGGISNETDPFVFPFPFEPMPITATLILEQSNIARNTATQSGGGLYNGFDSTATIEQSTFEYNVASNGASFGRGGGIFSDGTLDATNVTVSGNLAGQMGGGAYLSTTSTSDIRHSTIAANQVSLSAGFGGSGGGIFVEFLGDVTLYSTLVAENGLGNILNVRSPENPQDPPLSPVVSNVVPGQLPVFSTYDDVVGFVNSFASAFNLIGVVRDFIGLTHNINNNLVGSSGIPVAAGLQPLLANGGPTRTHAISRAGAAFDAGPTPDLLTAGPFFDQRGSDQDSIDGVFFFLRLVGAAVDIGAFELQASDGTSDDLLVTSNTFGRNEIRIFSVFNTVPPNPTSPPDPPPSGPLILPGPVIPFSQSEPGQTLNITQPNAPLGLLLNPYLNFPGEVRTAIADVNGDGFDDIITVPGRGGGPHVRVLFRDPNNRAMPFSLANTIDFFPYDDAFAGGIFVAAGDFNRDGFADIIVGADAGGGPHVVGVDGRSLTDQFNANQRNRTFNFTRLFSFFPYDIGFTGGVRVAVGDVNGDGTDDLITAAGPSGGPHVRVFDGRSLPANGNNGALAQLATPVGSFFPYITTFTGGVYVATTDINGDGRSDIITGAGPGGGPHVRVFSGLTGQDLVFTVLGQQVFGGFFAYSPFFTGGVRVGAGDFTGDGRGDIFTAAGSQNPGDPQHIRYFNVNDPAAFVQQIARALFDLHPFLDFRVGMEGANLGNVGGSTPGKGKPGGKSKTSANPPAAMFVAMSGFPDVSFASSVTPTTPSEGTRIPENDFSQPTGSASEVNSESTANLAMPEFSVFTTQSRNFAASEDSLQETELAGVSIARDNSSESAPSDQSDPDELPRVPESTIESHLDPIIDLMTLDSIYLDEELSEYLLNQL